MFPTNDANVIDRLAKFELKNRLLSSILNDDTVLEEKRKIVADIVFLYKYALWSRKELSDHFHLETSAIASLLQKYKVAKKRRLRYHSFKPPRPVDNPGPEVDGDAVFNPDVSIDEMKADW